MATRLGTARTYGDGNHARRPSRITEPIGEKQAVKSGAACHIRNVAMGNDMKRDGQEPTTGRILEFPCMYCGAPLKARRVQSYGRIPCRACGHTVPVVSPRQGSALRSVSSVHDQAASVKESWADLDDQEIAKRLRAARIGEWKRARRARKIAYSPLLPQYDDLTLFTLGLAFILLAAFEADMRRDLTFVWYGKPALFVPVCVGMLCSLVHAFTHRRKYEIEKWAMVLFAVLVNAGTGIYAAWLMLQQTRGWLIIFPAWNIVNGGMLLLFLRGGLIDTDCIVDRRITFVQLLTTALAVSTLLAICLGVFQLHWVFTFSIAVAYTMNLHKMLGHLTSPSDASSD